VLGLALLAPGALFLYRYLHRSDQVVRAIRCCYPSAAIPALRGRELRRAALLRCANAEAQECLAGLERARILDPAGDNARKSCAARCSSTQLAPVPSSTVAPRRARRVPPNPRNSLPPRPSTPAPAAPSHRIDRLGARVGDSSIGDSSIGTARRNRANAALSREPWLSVIRARRRRLCRPATLRVTINPFPSPRLATPRGDASAHVDSDARSPIPARVTLLCSPDESVKHALEDAAHDAREPRPSNRELRHSLSREGSSWSDRVPPFWRAGIGVCIGLSSAGLIASGRAAVCPPASTENTPTPLFLQRPLSNRVCDLRGARAGPQPDHGAVNGMCGDPARSCTNFATSDTRSTLICPPRRANAARRRFELARARRSEAVERAVTRAKTSYRHARRHSRPHPDRLLRWALFARFRSLRAARQVPASDADRRLNFAQPKPIGANGVERCSCARAIGT